ncbi:MAG: hypothetical protein COA45_03760 [Zetaproteobacteria bacterium]|nr:MAG: hypothetical protein COA45_03760 [Zetaproteobacteria bacterium]
MDRPFKTALIGLGKMGVKNAADAKVSAHYKYSSHIEALRDHPSFDCGALYDHDRSVEGQNFSNVEDIAKDYCPDVLVLATPPTGRLEIIKTFSNLKAIIMEKPIAYDLAQAQEIVEYCSSQNILLQINYWRRFDQTVIDLKKTFETKQDSPQVVFMTYGNGLRNNAVHLIDQIRYLFGEISDAKPSSIPQSSESFPIEGDVNIDFQLTLFGGAQVYAHALDFQQYREVGLDIWGRAGRTEFIQGGLVMRKSPLNDHRALDGDREIVSDQATLSITGAGTALYGLYDNLAKAMQGEAPLLSDGESALENERILEKIIS